VAGSDLIGDVVALALGVGLGAVSTGLGMVLAIASGRHRSAPRPPGSAPDPEPTGIVVITPEHLDAVHAARAARRRAVSNGTRREALRPYPGDNDA
jgi:hypothetical protein